MCKGGTSDFDYDGYEEIGSDVSTRTRPSAMELISPGKNSVCVTRTLWCEIPEVKQSAVLSKCHFNCLRRAEFFTFYE